MSNKELIDDINAVLMRYHDQHDSPGEAIDALEALGYIAGQIFSLAPDLEARRVGNGYFMAAIEMGLDNDRMGSTIH